MLPSRDSGAKVLLFFILSKCAAFFYDFLSFKRTFVRLSDSVGRLYQVDVRLDASVCQPCEH